MGYLLRGEIMPICFNGQLEIDVDRGVIYFHDGKLGKTILRISRLPLPMPVEKGKTLDLLDITCSDDQLVSWKSRLICAE